MSDERIEREREALRTIRGRWRLRGWHFSPLERVDGENEVIDSLYAVADSPVCWPSLERLLPDSDAPRLLIDDLEELYWRAESPWEKYRTVFDHEDSQRDLLRWPYGTFPATLRREVMYRFWELKTTTRFSVSDNPSVRALRDVNRPSEQVSDRHVVSLAAMVCIVRAIENLEAIRSSWNVASSRYRKGCPFDWMATQDIERLEPILGRVLDDPSERAFLVSKVAEGWRECRQAESWLVHADTLEFHEESVERAMKATEAETLDRVSETRKAQATQAARKPRAAISVDDVVAYFNAHLGKERKEKILYLVEHHGVSEATVERRIKEAKKKNLLS